MDGQASSMPTLGWSRKDSLLLLALAELVLVLRGWQLSHTVVTARDSIGYIRIAWHLEHEPLGTALRGSDQHPLYPAAILAVSRLVRPWLPDDLPLAMQRSSQLVSAAASLLLLVPMYLLGRELFDRRTAFFAAVLCQCLPASGQVMADGLAEPLFLMFAATALLAAIVGLRRGSRMLLAVAGLAGGLAYLTRPEGGLIVAATGLVLLGTWLVPRWRMPLGRFLDCGLALGLGALFVAGPYMAIIGNVTVKPTATQLLHASNSRDTGDQPASPSVVPGRTLRTPAVLAVFAPASAAHYRYRWALWALGNSLVIGSFYLGLLPTLLGLWHWRRLLMTHLGAWVILLTVLLLSVSLFKVAATMGYLSDRHMILILVLADFWMAAGLTVLGGGLARFVQWLRPRLARGFWGQETCWSAVFFLALALLPLVRTLAPLHSERAGFRQAGEWLAQHVPSGDFVEDPYCWSHFFAGRMFLEGIDGLPHQNPPVHYVVYESSANKHSRLYLLSEAQLKQAGGSLVASWPADRGREPAEIRIYAVPGALPPPSPLGATLPPFLRAQLGL